MESKAFYCPSCRSATGEEHEQCPVCETGRPPLGWPEDVYIGRTVGGKYRIDRRVSSGGFGIIFLATHLHQGTEIGAVIVKMLHPEHCFDPAVTKRFVNEARAARSITSPHVVKIFDLDFDKGMVPFMVQEYVEGETLSQLLAREEKLGAARTIDIALQIAEGMKEAHEKGITHRDLKPDNIIIQGTGRGDFVKLIDFGIARIRTQSTIQTASFIGTPRYMSPEQIQGRNPDHRSDIFALGVIMFEMATGEAHIPSTGSEMDYLHLNTQGEPRTILELEPGAPPPLSAVVASMLAKDPDARPPDMGSIIEVLEGIRAPAPPADAPADATRTIPLPPRPAPTAPKKPPRPPVESVHTRPTEKLESAVVLKEPPPAKRRAAALLLPVVALLAASLALLVLLLGPWRRAGREAPAPGAPAAATAAPAAPPDAAIDTAAGAAADAVAVEPAVEPEAPGGAELRQEETPEAQGGGPTGKPDAAGPMGEDVKKKKKGDPWTKI